MVKNVSTTRPRGSSNTAVRIRTTRTKIVTF